ncbi:hypothetical protein [Streptomyces virginiae]|uniref:hypothetical protein n=1 Tax=Streptomyces virginiae TaxID=1961 RepID=UPI00224D5A41|nr:hypothetical protein [Streptomyces virginiae]MCX4721568.1 hypothetical protein [Streptomyces virginiae]MCX5276900.1 hypothetical protein [Streptomyces virginiae]
MPIWPVRALVVRTRKVTAPAAAVAGVLNLSSPVTTSSGSPLRGGGPAPMSATTPAAVPAVRRPRLVHAAHDLLLCSLWHRMVVRLVRLVRVGGRLRSGRAAHRRVRQDPIGPATMPSGNGTSAEPSTVMVAGSGELLRTKASGRLPWPTSDVDDYAYDNLGVERGQHVRHAVDIRLPAAC